MRFFGDVFLKSSSSSPQNLTPFGLDLIRKSSCFQKSAGWKNSVLLGQVFSLSSVEPTLVFFCVGSTDEWVFCMFGFSALRLIAPVFILDFIGLSGALSSVEPTLFKP